MTSRINPRKHKVAPAWARVFGCRRKPAAFYGLPRSGSVAFVRWVGRQLNRGSLLISVLCLAKRGIKNLIEFGRFFAKVQLFSTAISAGVRNSGDPDEDR